MLIALVTWRGLPELAADDQLLRDALVRRGADARAVVWDDPDADWRSFDAIVIRSTWDYHKRFDEFHAWLDRMDGLPLWNPPAVTASAGPESPTTSSGGVTRGPKAPFPIWPSELSPQHFTPPEMSTAQVWAIEVPMALTPLVPTSSPKKNGSLRMLLGGCRRPILLASRYSYKVLLS